MQGTFKLPVAVLMLLTLLPALPLRAEAPQTFEARYDASYDDYSAAASRSLVFDAASGHYTLQQDIRLTLFGATVSSISERSTFQWQDEQPLPQAYEFRQRGIGSRARSARFDYASNQVEFTVNERSGTLPLAGAVFDELSGYLVLKEQLATGNTEISLRVLDRDEVENQRYQVLGEERLATPIGEYTALRVARLREGNSARQTELWLAPALDYALVKLVQTEPNGRIIRLDITELTLAGKAVGN